MVDLILLKPILEKIVGHGGNEIAAPERHDPCRDALR
jgi:hypothetical protein